jgi:hypothetical protein
LTDERVTRTGELNYRTGARICSRLIMSLHKEYTPSDPDDALAKLTSVNVLRDCRFACECQQRVLDCGGIPAGYRVVRP